MDEPRKETGDGWPRGTYARVAKRLRPRVSPEAVRLVALGRAKSARISRALETERRRLTMKDQSPLAAAG